MLYTYIGGEKKELEKDSNHFTVRLDADQTAKRASVEQDKVAKVSSGSCKVKSDDIEGAMEHLRLDGVVAHHLYKLDKADFLITDRVFVRFKPETSKQAKSEILNKYGLRRLSAGEQSQELFQLTKHTGMNPVKLVVKLTEEEDCVELAEHDCNHQIKRTSLQYDPYFQKQWHLHGAYGARVDEAWTALGHMGEEYDPVIAVVDDGCKLDHPDFDGPGKFADWGYMEGRDLIHSKHPAANPAKMYQEGANHGTSCSGVVAAEADGAMTMGACPGARLLPIKIESQGGALFISDSKILTMLDFLADKADVMSNSWGATPTEYWSKAVRDRIEELSKTGGKRGKGIVFLWAAGNENCPIQHASSIDIPFTNGWAYDYSSGAWAWSGPETSRVFNRNLTQLPGVMFIAALASNGQRSHYSNYGTGVDLTAPSNNLHSYYRMYVEGEGITTTTSNTVTAEFGGTSSATPLVAGIAGLVISANPHLSAAEIIAVLKQTARKDLDLTPYDRTPPANFDPDTSWDVSPAAPFDDPEFKDIGVAEGTWSPWFGHGCVDAHAAVTQAKLLWPDHIPEPAPIEEDEAEAPSDKGGLCGFFKRLFG